MRPPGGSFQKDGSRPDYEDQRIWANSIGTRKPLSVFEEYRDKIGVLRAVTLRGCSEDERGGGGEGLEGSLAVKC